MANNTENLVSLADRTTEEQREIAIKGGVASGKARREKKTLKEELELALEVGDTKHQVVSGIINKAKSGNPRAFESIWEKTQTAETDTALTDSDDVLYFGAYIYGTKSEEYRKLKERGREDLCKLVEQGEAEAEEFAKKQAIIQEWNKAQAPHKDNILRAMNQYEDVRNGWSGQYHEQLELALKGNDSAKKFILEALAYSVNDLDELMRKLCIKSDT